MSDLTAKKNPLKLGDLIYTRKVVRFTEKGALYNENNGPALYFGVLLGQVGSKHDAVSPEQVFSLLGAAGLVGLDDVEEALGKENAEKVAELVQKKYAPDGKLAAPEEQKKKAILSLAEAKAEGIKVN